MRSTFSSRRSAAALALAVAALLVSGCSSTKLTLRVRASPDANAGQPFYMVVRSTEQAAYVTESYESVAAKVFATPADPSVMRAIVIHPGQTKKLTFDKPEQAQALGIYFLFTKPGERWKTARSAPLPSSVDIEVAANQIKEDS